MKVAFIGLGKLGHPVASVMAQHYDVLGYDIRTLPLNTEVATANTLAEAIDGRDLIFIAIQTPHSSEYGGSTPASHLPPKDFSYDHVQAVLTEVDKVATPNQLVVLISTVLPGTVRSKLRPLLTKARFIYNPYLIAMGSVQWDMVHPEMLIIGTEDGAESGDAKILRDFYQPIMQNDPRVIVGTWEEAECVKVFYNCYSDDTEVFTSDGWRLFKDLTGSESIFSLNPQSQVAEFVGHQPVPAQDWSGLMISFKNKKEDLLVTPEHWMYASVKNGPWSKVQAKDLVGLNPEEYKFYRSANWAGRCDEVVTIASSQIPTQLWVQFMAWYLAEGCTTQNSHESWSITISQSKDVNPSKYAAVEEVVRGITAIRRISYHAGPHGFVFYDRDLGQYLSEFGMSFDKYVPQFVKDLNTEYLKTFLSVYGDADGTHDGDGDVVYYATSSLRMASDIGELLVKTGDWPSYREMVSPLSGRVCQLVYHLRKKSNSPQVKVVDYVGKVWCTTLERNHVMLVRRNKKCSWQGNTFISVKIGLVNMIQDVAVRLGHTNTDVVTKALADSKQRIMSSAYMKAGMGDGGGCHPRDNIALSYIAEQLGLGYDLFAAVMTAREQQARSLADYLASFGMPVVIMGESYKPGVPYTDGSYSHLVAHYFNEPVSYDCILQDPAVYLLGHRGHHQTEPYPAGSVIVDPWRECPQIKGCRVYHYGNSRIFGGFSGTRA